MTETIVILLAITMRSLSGEYDVVEVKQPSVELCRTRRDDRGFWAQFAKPGQMAIGASCLHVTKVLLKGEGA